MTVSSRLITEMGNHGFRAVNELSPHGMIFEGMGNKRRVTIKLPEQQPDDEEKAVKSMVTDGLAKASAQSNKVKPRGR